MYYATYHGLHDWYKHCFEHLGWMLLAKDRGYKTKLKAYMESIYRLHEALVDNIELTKDPDRVRDLENLLHNTKILEKNAKRILNTSKRSSSK